MDIDEYKKNRVKDLEFLTQLKLNNPQIKNCKVCHKNIELYSERDEYNEFMKLMENKEKYIEFFVDRCKNLDLNKLKFNGNDSREIRDVEYNRYIAHKDQAVYNTKLLFNNFLGDELYRHDKS